MVSKGKEGEDTPMGPEEFMATLRSMKEIINDLYRRINKTREEESSVKSEVLGKGGGPAEPSSPFSSSSSTNGASEHSSHKNNPSKNFSHAHNCIY